MIYDIDGALSKVNQKAAMKHYKSGHSKLSEADPPNPIPPNDKSLIKHDLSQKANSTIIQDVAGTKSPANISGIRL